MREFVPELLAVVVLILVVATGGEVGLLGDSLSVRVCVVVETDVALGGTGEVLEDGHRTV